jgi:ribonuclease Z
MRYIDNENIRLYSVGLFGSWCLHKPTKTLFDCGDGVGQFLRYRIFAVDRIVLGHSHIDHISGLLAFIGLRNRTLGANEKPLEIVYNMDDPFLAKFISLVRDMYPQHSLKFPLYFHDIRPGCSYEISPKVYMKAFKTSHTNWSQGFCVYNESYGLKPGVDPKTVGAKIRSGEIRREDVTVRRDIKTFAYLLDNAGFDVEEVVGAKELVLDCTFLNEEDRDKMTHATIRECEETIKASGCRKAYLAHISPRYERTRGEIMIWTAESGLTLNGRSVTFDEMAKEKSDTDESEPSE